MTYDEALQVILSQPKTFQRVGPNYDAWQISEMSAIARFVSGDDSVISQVSSLTTSTGKWLDTFGQLMGVSRRERERDSLYAARVQNTCLANHCAPNCIMSFLSLSLDITTTVTENLPEVGWNLSVTNSSVLVDEASLSEALVRVRPAGVPFQYEYPSGGLYMTTNVFRNRPLGYGAFYSANTKTKTPTLGGATNAATSLLPTPFLTDPTINPSLG